jgi:TrmH family RNA methyltransferase
VIRTIESDQNPLFKSLKRVLAPRGIHKEGEAIVAGRKLVEETLDALPGQVAAWMTAGDAIPPPEGAPHGMDWYQLAPALFREVDVFGTRAPMLLVNVPPLPVWEPAEGIPEGVSLLIPFQDPENVGATIRSAVAFGVDQIILLEESAHPFHPKTLRASGGAVLRARLYEGPSIKKLPAGLDILPLSTEGRNISTFTFPERFALLPGLEGGGLPEAWRSRALTVPIRPEVESLNAAAAVAVALYAWSVSRSRRG